jgi:hypothetical protein
MPGMTNSPIIFAFLPPSLYELWWTSRLSPPVLSKCNASKDVLCVKSTFTAFTRIAPSPFAKASAGQVGPNIGHAMTNVFFAKSLSRPSYCFPSGSWILKIKKVPWRFPARALFIDLSLDFSTSRSP